MLNLIKQKIFQVILINYLKNKCKYWWLLRHMMKFFKSIKEKWSIESLTSLIWNLQETFSLIFKNKLRQMSWLKFELKSIRLNLREHNSKSEKIWKTSIKRLISLKLKWTKKVQHCLNSWKETLQDAHLVIQT